MTQYNVFVYTHELEHKNWRFLRSFDYFLTAKSGHVLISKSSRFFVNLKFDVEILESGGKYLKILLFTISCPLFYNFLVSL